MGAPGLATVLEIDKDMVDQIAHPISKMMIGDLCNTSVAFKIDPRPHFKIGYRLKALPVMEEWHWYCAANIDNSYRLHALPDSITLAPITLHDLDRANYRRIDNDIVPGSTLDPLDVFEVFSYSFGFQETQIFRSAMLKSSGVMVGSSAMASIGIVETAAPQRLDILVGIKGSRSMSAPERVRDEYARTVGALSTAHMSFLSATHAFVLDPELMFNKVALLRGTEFPPIQQDSQHWLQLLHLGWEVYRHNGASGFTLNIACPAFRRSLWGGEGIWHASWSDTLVSGEDYYYQLAALSFKHDNLFLIMTTSSRYYVGVIESLVDVDHILRHISIAICCLALQFGSGPGIIL
ncbi:hypothetical protein BT96DRAFT_948501 [Gymnopus androsaceus JB14]|uniref:Uncharacterized protein n=1 Tax=Gymnopus androsaceus JB14 TaxID=1447944 RepID=A0A6A4GNV2_9AGAR|nr:hypothetical protein BT96DRAFT_948501 [Gymnopus androsaceus JB14]